ncbi:MAG: TMAO reductase system periplasmic protein TorT [Gammaproteobacteria bacterium]|nr:TMAO reductase system periplasmic protein TorT [Gammaproteobacteria bacterium]
MQGNHQTIRHVQGLDSIVKRAVKNWGCLSLGFVLYVTPIQTLPATSQLIDGWQPAFDYTGQPYRIPYPVAMPTTRHWSFCVVYPHLKDAYWLAVNYGMTDEAKRLGVELRLFEAGGYPRLEQQRKLVTRCSEMSGVDALILGTVSFQGLSDLVQDISRKMPILATINDIDNKNISAKVGVSWYEMGRSVGEYIVQRHVTGRESVPVAWFPGPKGAGWVPFVDQGFRDALADSNIAIVTTGWGDTGKAIQRNLVQDALDGHPEIRYLVGNALMAEAAISVLRERDLRNEIKILSTYFTPGVFRGIARSRILAAPTDSPVLQGRLSIIQAVNLLEGHSYEQHMGPVIRVIDKGNLHNFDLNESLAPVTFSPVFHFVPEKGDPAFRPGPD